MQTSRNPSKSCCLANIDHLSNRKYLLTYFTYVVCRTLFRPRLPGCSTTHVRTVARKPTTDLAAVHNQSPRAAGPLAKNKQRWWKEDQQKPTPGGSLFVFLNGAEGHSSLERRRPAHPPPLRASGSERKPFSWPRDRARKSQSTPTLDVRERRQPAHNSCCTLWRRAPTVAASKHHHNSRHPGYTPQTGG